MTFDQKFNGEIFFVDIVDEKLTFVFGAEEDKKIFTATHTNPRDPEVVTKMKDQMGRVSKLVASKTGKYIFAANDRMIYIYSSSEERPIYTYHRQDGDRDNLDETVPQFISDEQIVFTTG